MKKSASWRMWSSVALFVLSLVMIWPTVKWYSLSQEERDRAEASVQPETQNPLLREILDQLQAEGGESLIAHYRDLYETSKGTLKLGLDLQGGMYLSYTVEPTPGLDAQEALDQALEVIRNRIDEFGVSEPSITRQGNDRIIVQLPGVRDPARARSIVERQALLEFKIVAYPNDEHPAPATVPVMRQIESYLSDWSGDTLSVPEPVGDSLSLPGGEVTLPSVPSGEESLSLPSLPSGDEFTMPEEVSSTPEEEPLDFDLQVAGELTGLIVSLDDQSARKLRVSPGDWGVRTGDDLDRFLDLINDPGVDSILTQANLEFVFGREGETVYGDMVPVFLMPADVTRGWERQADVETPWYLLTGSNLTDVTIRVGGQQTISQEPYLILEFDSEGSSRWERITGENVDERVAIVLDGTIYSVAVIRERIASSGTRLSGGFTVEEARDLRLVLKAGSLPAKLIIAEEQTIGPSLGRRSISQGMTAAIIGICLVAAFMIVYYGVGGIIAIMALIFDLLIILGVLCFPGPFAHLGVAGLNAALTLPGIAGIILTIGMAVDASVLIYERIREERSSGKGIRTAVQAGYSRAFVTILDANLTTLITALVLYRFGTGPIRGFAVTLSIGILASMFCSLVFTRAVITMILRNRKVSDLSLGRLALLRDKHYKIVNVRKKTYILSAVAIIVGIAAFAVNGGLNLAIDFTGGLETSVVRAEAIPSEELKNELEAQGLLSVQVQSLVDYAGDGAAYVVRTSTSDKDEVYEALSACGCSSMEESGSDDSSFIKQIGPRVGSELRSKAINAILLAMFFIVLYIWYRFQFKWGVAAVAALVHDILITVGMIALLRLEVSLTIIAALLTIVGYSINDTIVVFDRIREDRRLRKGKTLEETVNIGINETLSRTLVTSLTTFMAVFMLFIFGGGALSEFALTLMIGIIVGTYSSIFVASPILVDWHAALKKT